MRDIKFRAWDKNNKSMGEVTNLNFYDELVYLDETADGNTKPLRLENAELMQYTGLKDKNGTEIYEGDIIEATEQKIVRDWPEYKHEPKKKRRVRWSVYWDKAGYSLRSCMINKFYPMNNPSLQRYWEYEEEGKTKRTETSVDESGFAKRDYTQYTSFEVIGNIYENPELLDSMEE